MGKTNFKCHTFRCKPSQFGNFDIKILSKRTIVYSSVIHGHQFFSLFFFKTGHCRLKVFFLFFRRILKLKIKINYYYYCTLHTYCHSLVNQKMRILRKPTSMASMLFSINSPFFFVGSSFFFATPTTTVILPVLVFPLS